ncbi:hypothetical protein HK098_006705 [Nowakowskiella sp. JEL0407]|nr:hypothetical protein HK098_006705 [Nowakowskiella sp. JEL0407]
MSKLLSSSRGRRQSSLNSRQQFMVVNIREEDEEEGKPTSILKVKENVEISSTPAHVSLVPSALMATINDDVEAGVSYSVPPKKTKKSDEALKYAANIGEIEPIVSDSRPGSSESILHSPINTKSSEAPKIQSTESNDLELPSNTVPISKTSDISSLTETNSRVSISAQRDSKIFDQSETNTSELPVRIQDTPRSLVISTQPSSSSNPLGMSMSNSPISSKSGKSPVIAIPPLSRTREDVNTPTLLDPEYEWMVRLALQAAEEEEKELDKDDKDKSFRRFGKFFTF